MSTLDAFLAFSSELNEPFADFEESDEPGILAEMFGDRADEFQVFGMHGSGSQLALWEVDDKTLVVWADTGFEASVIATTFEEFLTLLPYDTGFLYDLAFAGLDTSPEEAAEQLSAAAEANPAHAQFIDWLKAQGLEPAADPQGVVDSARATSPDLSELIQQ